MVAVTNSSGSQSVIFRKLASGLEKGLYHRFWRYGLRRDLSQRVEPPQARIPLHVRPLEPGDIEALFGHRHGDIPAEDATEIGYRMQHLEADIPTCYVAVDETNGQPCYCQWLMGPAQNDKIQSKLWGFPVLGPKEALLENAYTPPAYRGQRVMSAAMYLIGEKARDIGADYVLTFVPESNMASLKGCKRAGFDIYMVHEQIDYLFGLVKRRNFRVLPPGDPRLSLLDA